MPLNCPQRGDNLRLPPGGGRKPPHKRGRWLAGIVVLAVAVCLVAAYWLFAPVHRPAAPKPSPQPEPTRTARQDEAEPTAGKPTAPAQPVPFCQRDFGAAAKRQKDIAALQAAGGLVHLLQRKQAAPPYDCAAFYLAQGLNVNAIGPDGLTALHYAIKVNNPDMLRFVIAHGANLKQKAGDKQLEPMGYAYYLALNNAKVDRNKVIAILNDALVELERNGETAQ